MLAWLLVGGLLIIYFLKLVLRIILSLACAAFAPTQTSSTSLVPLDNQQELAHIEQQLSHLATPT